MGDFFQDDVVEEERRLDGRPLVFEGQLFVVERIVEVASGVVDRPERPDDVRLPLGRQGHPLERLIAPRFAELGRQVAVALRPERQQVSPVFADDVGNVLGDLGRRRFQRMAADVDGLVAVDGVQRRNLIGEFEPLVGGARFEGVVHGHPDVAGGVAGIGSASGGLEAAGRAFLGQAEETALIVDPQAAVGVAIGLLASRHAVLDALVRRHDRLRIQAVVDVAFGIVEFAAVRIEEQVRLFADAERFRTDVILAHRPPRRVIAEDRAWRRSARRI